MAMIRALIIEDEQPSREAIKLLGNWEKYGIAEIDEAENGREGLRLVAARRPDLLLVDMKMPEMDGVEFLRRVSAEHPECVCIVISGYDDFEYARTAILSGAIDYLLKPINRHDLNDALAKAAALIGRRKREAGERIDQGIALNLSLPKLKETVFLRLVEDAGGVTPTHLSVIGADKPAEYQVAVFCLLNMTQVRREKFKGDTELFRFAVANLLNELELDGVNCFSFANPKSAREFILVLTLDPARPHGLRPDIEGLLKEGLDRLEKWLHLVASGGVGRPVQSHTQIRDSYLAARDLAWSANLAETAHRPIWAASAAEQGSPPPLIGRMPLIRHGLEEGNAAYAAAVVSDYVAEIRKAGRLSLAAADRLLDDFATLLHELALDLGVPNGWQPDMRSAGHDPDMPYDLTSLKQFESAMQDLLADFADYVRRTVKSAARFHVSDIKAYIDQHYNESIRIHTFTEKYYLSREYLMKQFKQAYGMGIYEYVQKVRMEKAAELLRDPELKIQDVSDLVGFKDKNYFSKAFKNHFGLSPTEYRSKEQNATFLP